MMVRRLIWTALIALAPSFAHAGAPLPPQTNWRYDEDWSTPRDTDNTDDPWWLPLKYRPLNASGSVYASFGIDARVRQEDFHNNDWGGGAAPNDGYVWLRFMPHADLHAGPVRAFAQLIASDAKGVAGGAGPADSTGLDLLQGFADVRLPLQGAAPGAGAMTLRLGRSLMPLGSERLVGVRYGPNVPQAFDGAQIIFKRGAVEARLFDARPTAIGQGDFDDEASKVKEIGGLYSTFNLTAGASLDVYWLHYRNSRAHFAQGAGDERRETYGVRYFGKRNNLAWNWEAMLQEGRFGAGKIRAWSLATETSYRFFNAPLQPRARLRANVASGDADASDSVLGTFNPMFPKGKYFGELSPIGPYNIVNVNPSVEFDLGRGVTFDLAAGAYWRARRGDGVYDVPGRLLRAPGGSKARFIGAQIEGVLAWRVTEALSASVSLSSFEPGAFIEKSGPAHRIQMVGFEAAYRF